MNKIKKFAAITLYLAIGLIVYTLWTTNGLIWDLYLILSGALFTWLISDFKSKLGPTLSFLLIFIILFLSAQKLTPIHHLSWDEIDTVKVVHYISSGNEVRKLEWKLTDKVLLNELKQFGSKGTKSIYCTRGSDEHIEVYSKRNRWQSYRIYGKNVKPVPQMRRPYKEECFHSSSEEYEQNIKPIILKLIAEKPINNGL